MDNSPQEPPAMPMIECIEPSEEQVRIPSKGDIEFGPGLLRVSSRENTSFEEAVEWLCQLALAVAVIYGAIVGMALGWLYFEPWLEAHDKLAGWGQALGGMIAIIATAFVATAESRRSRHQLEAQIKLQEAAMAHQAELQRNALEFQKDSDAQRQVTDRRRAVASLKAAYRLVRRPADAIEPYNSVSFRETYLPDITRAKQLVDSVNLSCFMTDDEHIALASMSVNVADFDLCLIEHISNKEHATPHLYSGLAKSKINTFSYWLNKIDPSFQFEDIALTAEEAVAIVPDVTP